AADKIRPAPLPATAPYLQKPKLERPAAAPATGPRPKPASSRSLWLGIAAAAALVIVGGGVYVLFIMNPAPDPGPVAKKKSDSKDPKGTDSVGGEADEELPLPTQTAGANLAELVPGDALAFISVSGHLWHAPGLAPLWQAVAKEAEEGFQKDMG